MRYFVLIAVLYAFPFDTPTFQGELSYIYYAYNNSGVDIPTNNANNSRLDLNIVNQTIIPTILPITEISKLKLLE